MRGRPGIPRDEAELEQEAREMVEFVQGDQYEISTNHRWAVGMAIRMALNVAPSLSGRNWIVIHCPNDQKSFVTTDAPVVLSTVVPRPDGFWGGVGFGNADALITFPLTQSCALVMFGQDGSFQHKTVGAEQIRHCNLASADRCQRFVIGRDEALVRCLADRLRLNEKSWTPKMQRG
jgi:hypothetical protein